MRVNVNTMNGAPEDPRYFVTVFDQSSNAGDGNLKLALGPFATKDEADAKVQTVRDYCYQADPWTHFLAFGVTAFGATLAATFKAPPLNKVLL